MVKIKYLLLLSFLAGFISVSAQQITVKATTDTTKYKVGDYITYKLEFAYDKNIKINYPSLKDTIKNLDFIEEQNPEKHESSIKVMETHKYIFSKYDSSIVHIPSFKILYTDNSNNQGFVTVNPLTIVIEKLPVDTTKDIMDVKPPVEIPFNWIWVIIIIGIAAILAAAGYFIYDYNKKKNRPVEKTIIIPPDVVAYNELQALKEKELWQRGKIKEYHSEITGIIRKYFEARFDFPALEMTTGEVLQGLKNVFAKHEVIRLTENFLNNADLVKFAKFIPMSAINEEMMEQAFEIVELTKPIDIIESKEEGNNV